MPVFDYIARDAAGAAVRGRAQAQDLRELASLLRRQGLFLVSARDGQPGGGARVWLKPRDLAEFTHHMATLLGAGLTVLAALQTVEEHADEPGLRELASLLRERVEGGASLSQALGAVAGGLPALVTGVLASGEATGRLDEAFGRLNAYLERELEFRRKVREAVAYPTVVLVAAVLVVVAFLTYVVPAFERVYRAAGAQLPALTRGLMVTSRAVRSLLPGLALVVPFLLVPQLRTRLGTGIRPVVEPLVERLPRVGQLVRTARAARFLHALGSALTAGVPLLQALEVASSAAGRRDWLLTLRETVERGERLTDGLRRLGDVPPLAARVLAVGEQTGQVGEMALRAAQVLERDVDLGVRRLLAALEPALTVVMAGVVGVLLLALYMPIFQLGRAVLHR